MTNFCVRFENYHTAFLINMYFRPPLIIMNPQLQQQLHDLVTRLKNITLVVFCYVNFHFLSLTSGLGIFVFFLRCETPKFTKKHLQKKKSIICIDVAVTGTHHHNAGSLYPNLTFDLKHFENYPVTFHVNIIVLIPLFKLNKIICKNVIFILCYVRK